MKTLIALNFIGSLLLAISLIAFQKYELMLLVGAPLLLGFWVLAAVNLASIFVFWKRHRFRALVPLGSFTAAAITSVLVIELGTDIVLRNTPCRPKTFFRGETREELGQIAKQLVGHGFKKILTYPSKPTEVHMLTGYQKKDVDPKILATLHKHGFKRTHVDDRQEIVMFGYYHR